MGYQSNQYGFSLLTDSHAGEKQVIDEALAAQFLRDVQVLAEKYNEGRARQLVYLGWDWVDAS